MNRFVILLILFISGCGFSKYPGYSYHSENLHYQRVQLGDGIVYHPDSCFIDYKVTFFPIEHPEKKIESTLKFAQLNKDLLSDSIFKNVQKGDLLKIKTSDNPLYMNDLCKSSEFNKGDAYEIEVFVEEVYNLYLQEEDANVVEFKSIKHYLSFVSSPNLYMYTNGIYIKTIESDTSKESVSGEIVLDYKGYSLEDDSLDIPDYPLKFNTKDQYQVIEGIEIALANMHFNDSVLVIIPSYLAFGELGSKNGNVPPYTALKYYLKVYTAREYQQILEKENQDNASL